MTNMVYLIVKPFGLVQIFFLLGVRTVALPTLVFWQLLKLIINFHVDLCWHFLILGITFMTLPMRMLTALKNEVKVSLSCRNLYKPFYFLFFGGYTYALCYSITSHFYLAVLF